MKLLFVKHLCIIIVTLIGCVSRTLYAEDCIKEQTKAVLHYYQNINNYQFERANKDLKFFLDASLEDREYLRKFLKPEKIHYLASVLSCIRNEDLLRTLIKHQGVKSWEEI